MDDVLLASNNIELNEDTKQCLDSTFKIKDLGLVKYFLGLEVARSPAGINLSQHKYTLDLLKETDFTLSKPTITPMSLNTRLTKEGVSL